jgi:hypothetical protein
MSILIEWEHMFAMGSAGYDYAFFERALRSRIFAAARAFAHGSRLRLPDGLALLLLSLDERSPSPDWYGRAAARWHARLVIDLRGIDIAASQPAGDPGLQAGLLLDGYRAHGSHRSPDDPSLHV